MTLAPDYIELEFQHWHLLPLECRLEDIPLAGAEVTGLAELRIGNAIMLAAGNLDAAPTRYATRSDGSLDYTEASRPEPT